jgi:O-antigen ligase
VERSPQAEQNPEPDRLARWLETGLAVVVLLAPLPFGSVGPRGRLALEVGALALCALWFVRARVHHTPLPSRLAVAGIVGLLGLGLLQLAPLGGGVVSVLSPEAMRIRALTAPPPDVLAAESRLLGIDPTGLESPAAVSLDRGATGSALRTGSAIAALFFVGATVGARCGLRRIAAALVISGSLQGLYGLLVLVSGHQKIWLYPKLHYLDSATGTFVNRNHFACFLAMALACGTALTLARLRRGGGPRSVRELGRFLGGEGGPALLAGLLLLVVLAGLLASFSRAGIALGLGAFLATFLLGTGAARLRKRLAAALLLVGVALIPLAQIGVERLTKRYSEAAADFTSAGGRATVWQDSLRMAAAFPLLGTGLGTFARTYPLYRSPEVRLRYRHAHNDLIQALVESGIVGLACVALLLTPVVRNVVGGLTLSKGMLGLGAAAAVCVLLLHSLIDFNLRIPANAATGAILAGCLIGMPWTGRG